MQLFVVQLLSGLASAASLFLVASGLSLIFGVTRIVNFAHGAFFMLGAYIAFTLTDRFSGPFGFWGGMALAAVIVGLLGALFEILLLRRIYRAPELFQLLATFGATLVVQDLVLLIWGPDDLLAPRAPGLAGAVGSGRQARAVLRSLPHRARTAGAGASVAHASSHALGRAGARRDAGPRHGRRARRQSEVAVHRRLRARHVSRRPRRRAAGAARSGRPHDGPAHHRRDFRRRGDRRPGIDRRRFRRRDSRLAAQRLRHPDPAEDLARPRVSVDGGRAGASGRGACSAGRRARRECPAPSP